MDKKELQRIEEKLQACNGSKDAYFVANEILQCAYSKPIQTQADEEAMRLRKFLLYDVIQYMLKCEEPKEWGLKTLSQLFYSGVCANEENATPLMFDMCDLKEKDPELRFVSRFLAVNSNGSPIRAYRAFLDLYLILEDMVIIMQQPS